MALKDKIKYQPNKIHRLKNPSSFIVVVLKSLAARVCICCGEKIESFEQSTAHWERKLNENLGTE